MFLNLSKSFSPLGLSNAIEFDAFIFNGGEPHIKIQSDLSKTKEVFITHRIKSFNDLGLLLVAVNALWNMKVESLHLFLPYFPGARQDRLMVTGEPLTVKVYADLINQQGFKSVTILDPHSEVTPALIENCTVVTNHKFIKLVTEQLSEDLVLISPDGGALKKIYKVASYLEKYEVVECSKTRNVQTGKLSGFKVYSDDLAGKYCLIVDDICDGGGTFLGLAKELKSKNAGKLGLAVSHGIFSKGLGTLTEIFDDVFTTDAFQTLEENQKLTQITLSQIIK